MCLIKLIAIIFIATAMYDIRTLVHLNGTGPMAVSLITPVYLL